MKNRGNFFQFIHSPSASNAIWSIHPVTEDVVTMCQSCKAEARHSKYVLEQGFSFQHNSGCDIGGDWPDANMLKSRSDRAFELAVRLSNILEIETDASLAVSTLSFLSAVACEVAAENTGESLVDVVDDFVKDMERALPRQYRHSPTLMRTT